MRRSGWVLGVAVAAFPLACGGMTTEDAAGDDDAADDGSDGPVLDGGTGGGTGGAVAATGGAPATGGQSATGGSALVACSDHAECTLIPAACCGACEPVQATDLVAVNGYGYLLRPLCEVDCGPCPEASEVDKTADSFIARCIEETCTVVDVRDDYAECAADEDCFLRNGSDCCEDCDDSGYIAVSSLNFVFELACPEIPCPPCGAPPEGLSAQCNPDTQRCEKVQD